MSDRPYDTTINEYDTGQRTRTDEAREQGRQVGQTARSEAESAAGTAKQQAGRVTDEAKAQGRNLMEEAKNQAREQARGQTERVSSLARDVAGQARALSEGRPDEAGQVGRYVQQATDGIERFAQGLDERGFDGAVEDLTNFARRRPAVFLIGAAAAGFAVGRLMRGARDAQSSDTSSQWAASPTPTVTSTTGATSEPAYGVPETPVVTTTPTEPRAEW